MTAAEDFGLCHTDLCGSRCSVAILPQWGMLLTTLVGSIWMEEGFMCLRQHQAASSFAKTG